MDVGTASGYAGQLRSGRAHAVGAAVLVATLAVMLPPLVGWVQQAVAAAVLVALAGVAVRLRIMPLLRALVFLAATFLCYVLGALLDLSPAGTTVLVAAAPLTVLLACSRVASLRPTAPWLRPGRPSAGMLALAAAAVAGPAVVLPVWTVVADPEPTGFMRGLFTVPSWLAVLGILGFALVNSVVEEALFRGVVLGALLQTWRAPAAVIGQAVVFGVAHWAGFPSGWLGMAMAACWGAALGVIRVRSGGILTSYVAHVLVDATIGVLVLVLLS